jgi:hypothetical protein
MFKKNSLIVGAFSLLVISVLGVVVFNASKNINSSAKPSISSNTTINDNGLSVPYLEESARKPTFVKADRIETNNTEEELKSSLDAISTTVKIESGSNSSENINVTVKPKQNETPKQDPYVFYAPKPNPPVDQIVNKPNLSPAPIPAPTPLPIPNPTPAPMPSPTPRNDERKESFRSALNRLKNRGSEILVPISNGNIYALNFAGDSDLNNVLSYEHDINSIKKGYSMFGSKTHLDTLKCDRYIPNCKQIMRKYSNGRYGVVLSTLENYMN